MGLFSKKRDSSPGGLFAKFRRHSAEGGHPHIVLRLVAVGDGAMDLPDAVPTSYALQITGPGNQPLPDFELTNDYASWTAKTFTSDDDREASRRCWAALKYTRVLDIMGTASPVDANNVPSWSSPRQRGRDIELEDRLATAELTDDLAPTPADLHAPARMSDANDPLVGALRWLADALQNLAVVRYVGIPPSSAFVQLFADVEIKIVFPASIDAPPPMTAHPPEVAPGAATRVVSNLTYSPAGGPGRVPIQYDYPTAQDMVYVYLFPAGTPVALPELGLEHDAWRRLVREIAGILTYFQDMPPTVQLVDWPLPDGDVPLRATDSEEMTDLAARTTEESRQQAAIVSAVSAATATGIEGTLAPESVETTTLVETETVPRQTPVAGQTTTMASEGESAPLLPSAVGDTRDTLAPPPTATASTVAPSKPIPATKPNFLAALAHRLTLNQNDPDHLKEMMGTGSSEGQVQDALSNVRFLSRAEYEKSVEHDALALETTV